MFRTFRRWLSILLFLFSALPLLFSSPAAGQVLQDSFDDNTLNTFLWTVSQGGSGPTVAETNQRLEITLPSDSKRSVDKDAFWAGYSSVYLLRGDFDIQVDYHLNIWPPDNGVRMGLRLGIGSAGFMSEKNSLSLMRISDGDFGGETYLIDFGGFGGIKGTTNTNDLSGKLRLVRSNKEVTGYYFRSGEWIALSTSLVTTEDMIFGPIAWSHDNAFSHQTVKVAFDNFVVAHGLLVCPVSDQPPQIQPTSFIVGIWRFDEGEGNVVKDSSGNSRHGKIINAKWTNDAKFNKALEFSPNSSVSIPSDEGIKVNSHTVMAWVKAGTAPDWQTIVGKTDKEGRNIGLFIVPAFAGVEGTISYSINPPAGLAQHWLQNGTKRVGDKNWHHVAMSYDEKTGVVKGYVDGEVDVEVKTPFKGSLYHSDTPLTIGSDGTLGYFMVNAIIDEVALFNQVLEQSQIREIMQKGLQSSFPQLAIPKAIPARFSYSMLLSKGVNMISLPIKLDSPLTARKFSEMTGASFVVRFNQKTQKFEAWVPEIATTDGFEIEGGRGYVINVPQEKTINFVGTGWGTPLPASPSFNPAMQPSNIWAFVVAGILSDDLVSKAYKLTVRNLRSGITIESYVENGRFAVPFVDMSRNSVVEDGSVFEIRIVDSAGNVYGTLNYQAGIHNLIMGKLIVKLAISDLVPTTTRLHQNYPNPFNPETWIPYQLSESTDVTIQIYDITGRLIRILRLGRKSPGLYISKDKAAYWDGKNEVGESVSSGVYYYKMQAGRYMAIRKMVIAK